MIKTSRLDLQLISNEDASFLVELMNTAKWISHIGDRKVHTEEDAINYMQDRMDADLSKKGFVNFVMIERSSRTKVGTCSLHDRPGIDGLDVGYALLTQYEGNGYATEGATAMVNLAFTRYSIDYISAITTNDNIGSGKVLQSLNFQHKGYVTLPEQSERLKLYILKR